MTKRPTQRNPERHPGDKPAVSPSPYMDGLGGNVRSPERQEWDSGGRRT